MQLHKRTTIEQVRLVLDWYSQGLVGRDEALARLGLKRRRFYELLRAYRNRKLVSITPPARPNKHRVIPSYIETAIRRELKAEQKLIANPDMPVRFYNYAAVRDEVVKQSGAEVSAQTVRRRAKAWGFHIPKPESKTKHTRVVLTTAAGLLLQHDASHHAWSPHAPLDSKTGKTVKWALITTIDDYSRMLLYADLWEEESTWAHITALKAVVEKYGVGGSYYTDNRSIFRFIERQETYWRTPKKTAGEVKTQWERAVKQCGMDTIWALSPEAKGKIERPYRWLQDRIVRSCAKQDVTDITGAKAVLRAEVDRYNNRQVHSTTGEIPSMRFARAAAEGNSVLKPLVLPEPYTSSKDVFCLVEERKVNGYNQISWRNHYFKVPRHIPERATVMLHIVPDPEAPEIRVWYKDELVQSISLAPLAAQYTERLTPSWINSR